MADVLQKVEWGGNHSLSLWADYNDTRKLSRSISPRCMPPWRPAPRFPNQTAEGPADPGGILETIKEAGEAHALTSLEYREDEPVEKILARLNDRYEASLAPSRS